MVFLSVMPLATQPFEFLDNFFHIFNIEISDNF